MPTFYNDVDGKLEELIKELLTNQAATSGSNIVSVPIHTGLSTSDVTEDLIFALVESAEETPSDTGNWLCSTTVAIYTQAESSPLGVHRQRVAEVRDLIMNDALKTNLNNEADSENIKLTTTAVQSRSFAPRVVNGYFIGKISFDVYCYGDRE